MRMSERTREKYPLLAGLLEDMASVVDESEPLRHAFSKVSTGREGALKKALEFPTNPWVAVGGEQSEGCDPRGSYSRERRNTIVLQLDLAERLTEGEDEVSGECVIAICRGLVHWLTETDWATPDSKPGTDFERALAASGGYSRPQTHHDAPVPAGDAVSGGPPPAAKEPAQEQQAVVHLLGATILDIAKRHLGQKYAFTPTPDYDDPDWRGPFDCAEYASYCAFRAYGIPYGVVADAAKRFNSYSGYWKRDAAKRGLQISWRDALNIPGAILLRFPPSGNPPPYGHVAISLGDGDSTYEALGRKYGVKKHRATNRSWNIGVLIPGVLYDTPDGIGGDLLVFKVLDPPAAYSEIVEQIEERLVALDYLTERQVDGIFDVTTATAVSAFQDDKGLVVDGEVGPDTGKALGLGRIWSNAPVADRPALAARPADAPTNVDGEVLTLARTLYGEARGEPREGIVAVANVILNRVRSPRYPNTVAKVCLQRLQFSCWNTRDPNRKVIETLTPGSNDLFDLLLAVASDAVSGRLPNPIGDALHYHNHRINPRWVSGSPAATRIARIGEHVFWTGIR